MKNILHISPCVTVKGGISAMLRYYLKTELPHNYDLLFLASHRDGSKFYKCYILFVGLFRMFFLMIRGKIDIVHLHCGDILSHYRKYLFFRLAQFFEKKVVLHLHGALFMEQYKNSPHFWQRRLKEFFENSKVVICLSESWKNDIGLLFPRSNRIVIPNGIPIPQINHMSDERKNKVRITFLGLIGPRKGIFDLLKVIKELVDEGLNIRVSIGGNGEIARLKKAIQMQSLENHVEYIGWVDQREKEMLLRRTDIFVLPSYGEGMPMSILEAMSYSIPIISTWVGGIPELVTHGHTGFLVSPGDTDDLSSKLRILIEDTRLRLDMGKNARKTVEEKHRIEAIVSKVGDVYDNA